LILPLQGVRILTLEHFGAGPFGSMYLADLGAEVIKVESRALGGDPARAMGPYFLGDHDGDYFQTFNFNKKSITLNLKTVRGREIFRRLATTADAVMNNLRGDQPDKLGLTYAALRDANPRIVCAHLSAYGRDNKRKTWPGYDYLMQAEAGYLHLSGEPGSPPTRMGLSIVDFMTGITAALALLAALLGTAKSGRGTDVDVSLFDVALHQLTYPGSWYLNQGLKTEPMARSAHPSAVPVQLIKTADGWIFVMCMLEKFWLALLEGIGRQDLASDPRFAALATRRQHRDELTAVLDAEFSRATTNDWLIKLNGLLPVAPVYDLATALDNPFAAAVGMVRTTPHPLRADFRALANPIKLDGARLKSQAAPALGADTAPLLAELGLTKSDIAELRRTNVI
jgi:crotonobetainyl-CoA:carnitine CoA-transferase CaiB-like acyl-CoA transferase